MNEPPRLVDESESELERSLLRAGTSYRVAPGVHAKTLSALGLAGATALTAGVAGSATLSVPPAAAASTSLLAKLGWFKATLAAATVSAIAAVPATYLLTREPAPIEQTAPVTIAKPKVAPVAPPVEPAAAPEEPQGAAVAAPEEITQNPAKPERAKAGLTSEALRAELSALDAARAALAAGNAQGALSLLDAYDRGNPRGLLKLEAEVLRIDALAKSGRPDAARKRAQAFLARHPNSVLASRVRGYTAE